MTYMTQDEIHREHEAAAEAHANRTWSYFLEDYEGNVIKEIYNVRFQDAPRGAEEDDDGEIVGYWHPFLP
jgi:hypothetical protein